MNNKDPLSRSRRERIAAGTSGAADVGGSRRIGIAAVGGILNAPAFEEGGNIGTDVKPV